MPSIQDNISEKIGPDVLSQLSEMSRKQKLSIIKKLEIADTMRDFAERCHRSTHGTKMEWDNFHHMVELYTESAMYDDISIMAGTQIGKTDFLVIYALACAWCGLNVFYMLPTDAYRDTYVPEKVQARIAASPEYAAMQKGDTKIADSKELMQFGRGMIKFVGAENPKSMTGFSADVLIVDEIDEVTNLGNVEIATGRFSKTSPYQWTRFISNPSTPDGPINVKYQDSDQRVFVFPCSECGEFHEIVLEESIVEELKDEEDNVLGYKLRDPEWRENSFKDPRCMCPKEGCCGHLDRHSKEAHWRPTTEPKYGGVGYKMPSWITPAVDIISVFRELQQTIGNPQKEVAFNKKHKSEPHFSSGSKLSESLLSKCAKEGRNFILEGNTAYWKFSFENEEVERVSHMGVDLNSKCIDVTITSPNPTNLLKRDLVFVGKIETNGQKTVDALNELVDRYNVEFTIVDYAGETDLSKQIKNKINCETVRCHFGNVAGMETKYNELESKISAKRSEILDQSLFDFRRKRVVLPENYKHLINGIYVTEMTSMVRSVEEDKRSGKFVSVWVGKKNNDLALSAAYCCLAASLCTGAILRGQELLS